MDYQLAFRQDKGFLIDYVSENIIKSIEFWNRESEDIYNQNIQGTLGTEETNQFARDAQQDDWLNEMIHIDCKTFCNSKRGKELNYSCGRTRSHVWLHKDDERILMIYADKDLDN